MGLVILGPVLAALTYTVLGPLDGAGSDPALRLILLVDLVYVLVVAALVAQRITRMVSARRNKSAGSKLHLRLTGTFALLALIPTVLVAVFSVLTINVGLEGWFSNRVGNVLGSSLNAAQAYEAEHRQDVTRDARALAGRINAERRRSFFMNDGELRQVLSLFGPQFPELTETFVIDGVGRIRARGPQSYEFDFEAPSPLDFDLAIDSGVLIIEDYANNEFRALLPMAGFQNRYLYVTRVVDGNILSLLDETKETVALYNQIEQDRGQILFEFGLLYIGFAVILILAAIWLGLWFAERLARPVGRLVSASQRVGAGDLSVQVIEDDHGDEIGQLGRHFNQMTAQLNAQRNELLNNTGQIEERRRLFDSVLSSVTSGVVGLDEDGGLKFANRSAYALLRLDDVTEETPLHMAIPEFAPLFHSLKSDAREVVEDQVNVVRSGRHETLLVRMSPRLIDDGVLEGYVISFDDVTNLVTAQRMAAWGDVARRIAHEIKNPLTPIQLSAERIKRKFRSKVGDEQDVLEQLSDVIVRQTNDLRRIVDDFSKFARMPEPERNVTDLSTVVRDAVLLQDAGQPDVAFEADLIEAPVLANVDQTMITQALTNVLKNAGEAIESYVEKHDAPDYARKIQVAFEQDDDVATITVQDNGIGLPEDRSRLFEPYVTTRDKGTGLGLPIVKKIIEEHGGTLVLQDADIFDGGTHAGAAAIITLPTLPQAAGEHQKAAE